MIVLDASITLAWMMPDEYDDLAERVLDAVKSEGGIVPSIWGLEVGNALVTAERGGRLKKDQVSKAIDLLARLPIRPAESSRESDFGQVLSLARRFGVTTYDAAYLEVSLRTASRLATLDAVMVRAARKAGIGVVH